MELPTAVQSDFRRILELGPEDKIPAELVRSYHTYERIVSICSAGQITTKELIMLALFGDHINEAEDKPAKKEKASAGEKPLGDKK